MGPSFDHDISMMKALRLYAGPKAREHIARHGLAPGHIGVVPGAAGGPKGLILGPLDRFLFGQWLPQSSQPIDLVGASIGAWRMATGCLANPAEAFKTLERDYIAQHYELQPGQKRPPAACVSEQFGNNLRSFFGGRVNEVLQHPRYRLHVFTSRGRGLLAREGKWRTPLGYGGAFLANALQRRLLGQFLERVVFSSQHAAMPFGPAGFKTRQIDLTTANFMQAVQASCSIPFVLQAVHDIAGAPPGAYWDGGITDYHLHLDYISSKMIIKNIADRAINTRTISRNGLDCIVQYSYSSTQTAIPTPQSATTTPTLQAEAGIVLYPHFQQAVVPGWLDKSLKWRHQATRHLDNILLLAPNPEWVKTLPNAKLPDRNDFIHYGNDLAGRVKAWTTAVAASQQMADEFAAWLEKPDVGEVRVI